MIFKPPRIIRFCYRYVLTGILIVFPLVLAIDTIISSQCLDGYALSFCIVCFILSLFGAILIHIGFWEKFFAVLILKENEIQWKCFFRKTRVMSLADCVEIGAYLEHAHSGIPSTQIYFSDHQYPQKNMSKNGAMKASQHLIKFWYTEELSNYLIRNYPSKKTGCLSAYKRKINR